MPGAAALSGPLRVVGCAGDGNQPTTPPPNSTRIHDPPTNPNPFFELVIKPSDGSPSFYGEPSTSSVFFRMSLFFPMRVCAVVRGEVQEGVRN